MHRPLTVTVLALAAGASLAQGTDPLRSPACVQALDALQAQEAAMPSSSGAPGARSGAAALASLEPYRKRVSRDCLGKEDLAPARTAQTPVAVSPVRLPPSAIPRAAAGSPPAVEVRPMRTIGQCDASGCWTSDGIRLNRLGPMLVGPPGVCSVQSGVLSCR